MSPFTSVALFLLISAKIESAVLQHQPSITDSFRQCLISMPVGSLTQCVGKSAMSSLQSVDNEAEFDLVDGVTLIKDANQEYRDVHAFGEPSDFRSLIDSASYVFGRRNMRWDMSYLYPGLSMHIAPSVSPGGTLEFVLEPHREAINAHSLKETSTGRLLMRQLLVPFLMGFKFNIASIVPILFAILAVIAKKAVIVSKLALIVSSAFALGTLFFNNNANSNRLQYQTHSSAGNQHFNPGFGGNYNRYPEEEYPDAVYYRSAQKNAENTHSDHQDQLNLYANLQDVVYEHRAAPNSAADKSSKGRNFAWSEDEKMKKLPTRK